MRTPLKSPAASSGDKDPGAFVKNGRHDWNGAIYFRDLRKALSRRRVVLRNAAAAFFKALRLPMVLIHPPGQDEALPLLSASYLVQGGANTFGELVMLLRLRQHRVLPQLKHSAKQFAQAPPMLLTTAKITTGRSGRTYETVGEPFFASGSSIHYSQLIAFWRSRQSAPVPSGALRPDGWKFLLATSKADRDSRHHCGLMRMSLLIVPKRRQS